MVLGLRVLGIAGIISPTVGLPVVPFCPFVLSRTPNTRNKRCRYDEGATGEPRPRRGFGVSVLGLWDLGLSGLGFREAFGLRA